MERIKRQYDIIQNGRNYEVIREYTPEEIVGKVIRFKEYFGENGGITVSGGEPLLQAEFVKAVFELCHKEGINTCLDTSGCIINDSVSSLLDYTDRLLLDVKYTDNNSYLKYVGCSLDSVMQFLSLAQSKKIKTTLRQVIIPTLNDNTQNIARLNDIALSHPNVDGVELLPFKKICQVKYDSLGIDFAFKNFSTPTPESIEQLSKLIKI